MTDVRAMLRRFDSDHVIIAVAAVAWWVIVSSLLPVLFRSPAFSHGFTLSAVAKLF